MVTIGKSSHKRILLIEDDAPMAEHFETILKAEGFAVYTTEYSEEGADLLALYDYDACLLDINLPDMSGFEVLRRTRAARINAPIIIVSGETKVDKKVRGLHFGANDYIAKPFNKDELVARVHAVVRNSGLALVQAQKDVEEQRRLLARTGAQTSNPESPSEIFVQKMFHDINSYLSALMALEAQERWSLFPSRQFRRAVVGYATLIASSLEQARTYGLGKDPAIEVASVAEIIETLTDLSRTLFPNHLIISFISDNAARHARLRTAKRLLLAVLLGLIHNARSYGRSPDGKARISFEASLSPNGDSIVFQISDMGVGIEEEIRKKLFREPVSSSGGRGVDLYFSKKTADMFGWTLKLQAKSGFSTTFELLVPTAR